MRPRFTSIVAGLGAAVAVVLIAGCGAPAAGGVSTAANVSGFDPTPATSAAGTGDAAGTGGGAGVAGAGVGAAGVGGAGVGSADGGASTYVAPPATAGPVTGTTATALTIAATMPVRHPRQTTAIVGGRLTEPGDGNAPLPGRVVWLERRGAGGGWVEVRRHLTGPDGGIAFRVHVAVGAAFRLVFRGNAVLARTVSPVWIVI